MRANLAPCNNLLSLAAFLDWRGIFALGCCYDQELLAEPSYLCGLWDIALLVVRNLADQKYSSARRTELGHRLMEIPGVSPLFASAFVASVSDQKVFKTGRYFAAWIGFVFRSKTHRAGRNGLVVYREREIDTSGRCLSLERWRSSIMHSAMALRDPGWSSCLSADLRRSLR